MQYLLTQEEMDAYTAVRIATSKMPDPVLLQTICTKAANEWPSWRGWKGDEEPRPWRCIITEEDEHYCDHCPVQAICPFEHKDWSK